MLGSAQNSTKAKHIGQRDPGLRSERQDFERPDGGMDFFFPTFTKFSGF